MLLPTSNNKSLSKEQAKALPHGKQVAGNV